MSKLKLPQEFMRRQQHFQVIKKYYNNNLLTLTYFLLVMNISFMKMHASTQKKFPNSPCFSKVHLFHKHSIPESVDDQRTFIQRLAKLGVDMDAYSNAYHQNDTKRYIFLHHAHSNLPKNINFFPPLCFL